MTIEAPLTDAMHRVAPRGSLIRFGVAGGFNSAVFLGAWTVSMALFPAFDVRVLWGVFWGLTGVLAHFVHRWFTFSDHKSVAWTLSAALPVYVFSLVGSSTTIGWLSAAYPGHVVWLGVANTLAWGVLIWAMMRAWVFQFENTTTHGSQESPGE